MYRQNIHLILGFVLSSAAAVLGDQLRAMNLARIPESLLRGVELNSRSTYDWCGFDYSGLDIYCIPGASCCMGSVIWECIPSTAQCCSRGTFCDAGTQCMVDTSTNTFYCEDSTSGSTAAPATASPAATTGSGSAPTPSTSNKPAPTGGQITPVVPKPGEGTRTKGDVVVAAVVAMVAVGFGMAVAH
ncbi:hypothetical protein B0H63DRAFT_546487 [Podospora didyma]|uniref:GPI anchored protein n=1 Tax=Podospora didyma TaxID=330526 RepID=A0AAE0TWC3_9PEZI|nr:hypothetical protein B0H63DRAFT_546487 [Podospora didyma]